MSININHNNSGNVTLQTSDIEGESTFIFPNLGIQGSGKVLVSGVATVADINGLTELIYGGADAFVKIDPNTYCCALVQNAPAEKANLAIADYSIAFGSNACASYPYQISHGVESNSNLGWRQSSQYICHLTTSGTEVRPMFTDYQSGSDYSNTISYIKGDAITRVRDKSALFNFDAVIFNGETSRELYMNNITGHLSNMTSVDFTISSENGVILLNAHGEPDETLNWLISMTELKLKTS